MRLSDLTYRRKSYLLIICSACLLVASYFLTIKKTIEINRSNRRLEVQLAEGKKAPEIIKDLEIEIDKWNSNFLAAMDLEQLQLDIFNQISKTCKKYDIELLSLRNVGSNVEKDVSIETYEVVLSSGFKPLVKVVHSLELEMNFARVSSIQFVVLKNRKSRKEELQLHIFIQSAVKI